MATTMTMDGAGRLGTPDGRTELRSTAEATGDVAWELDCTTGIMWRSSTWHTMLGHPYASGSTTGEEWFDLIHPDDQPRIRREFEDWLRSPDRRWRAEYRILRFDGTYAHVLSRACAVTKPERVIGTLTDISALREAEERLKERERQLEEAQEVARVGSWEFRCDDLSMTWSRELYRIYGVPETYDTRFDHALAALVPPEDQPVVQSAIARIAEEGAGEATWRIVRPSDGQIRSIWGRGRLIDEPGSPRRIVGVIQDITEQELARDELLKARRIASSQERLSTLGTLLAGVAHEINNPLSYIRGNGEICKVALDEIRERRDLPGGLADELGSMQSQLESLLKGVEQVAHVASSLKQVARSGVPGSRRVTQLNTVVEDALALAATNLPLHLEIRRDLQFDGQVETAPSELAQVILNLVLNAGEALRGQEEPRILVRTCERDGRAVVEVEDNGPGIPEDAQARVFTPFFTTKQEGTGLGLSVSRHIITDHGGRLTFRTQAGKGTCFLVELPVYEGGQS